MLSAWALLSTAVIICGYSIDDVDNTPYPWVCCLLAVSVGIGDLIALSKSIYPKLTRRMLRGKVDVNWGFKYLYWTLWWPLYLKKST